MNLSESNSWSEFLPKYWHHPKTYQNKTSKHFLTPTESDWQSARLTFLPKLLYLISQKPWYLHQGIKFTVKLFQRRQSSRDVHPVVAYPSCLQTTVASALFQRSSHTVPQALLMHTSTLPSYWVVPPTSWTSPWLQLVLRITVGKLVVIFL